MKMSDTVRGHRTELEQGARERYCSMSDGAQVRVLDFDLAREQRAGTVLLVPGFATVFQSWEEVVRDLVLRYRVVYFESREKGSCRMPDQRVERAVGLRRMALDLSEVERALGLDEEPYFALSSSTGGTILVEALSEAWIEPSAAVLIGPAIEHRLSRWAALGTSILPSALRWLAMPLYRRYLRHVHIDRGRHPEQYAKYLRAAEEVRLPRIRGLLWEMTRHQCWDLLPRVETPCLVVGAADDGMHAAEDGRRAQRLLAAARYVELADNRATHSLALIEVVEAYLAALQAERAPAVVRRATRPVVMEPAS